LASPSDPGALRVVGALGPGLHAPLVAEAATAAGVTRYVVRRPLSAEVAAVATLGDARLPSLAAPAVLQGRPVVVEPFVPGVDLDAALDAGLPPAAAAAALDDALAALAVAATRGVAHGALDLSVIRLGRDGVVRVRGFRGGASDAAVIADLREELPGPPDRAALVAWCAGWQGGEVLHPTALVGAEVSLGAAAAPAPDSNVVPWRVRLAGTAAFTLIIGLVSGWFLAPPPASTVTVPGAAWVEVRCPGEPPLRALGDHAPLRAVGGPCEARAGDPLAVGVVDGGAPRTCTRSAAELVCR
jgi:hypothetical protein